MSPPSTAPRRTQAERSDATRRRLMQATLDCLGELGAAGTTIGRICARAGVSRGALLHHFPSKHELLAHAFMHRQAVRAAELSPPPAATAAVRSVRDEIAATRARMEADFTVSLEFFNAVRTDAELRRAFQQVCEQQDPTLAARYELLGAELDTVPSPLPTRYVIGCFLRGLCLEALVSDPDTVASTYEQFVAILEHYHRRSGGAPAP